MHLRCYPMVWHEAWPEKPGRLMQFLVMNTKSKYYHAPCAGCGQRIRQGRQYILDPERNSGTAHGKGVPLVYHRVCYERIKRRT